MESNNLTREELVTQQMRLLFAKYGYSHYSMGKFEAYDLYRENKAFLKSGGIITFTDGSGHLMALKPDVTMSIVKNTPQDADVRKLYYAENVFRTDAHDGECREISQTGVEYIGAKGTYAETEVLILASKCLALIDRNYVLDLSHMNYLTALLDALTEEEEVREALLSAVRGKNAGAVEALLRTAQLTGKAAQSLKKLTTLGGSFNETLLQARALCVCDEMTTACDELQAIYEALCAAGCEARVRLDFSIVNDVNYYNGIIFQGFVHGAARAVLAGGRYDNLMRRFDKPQAALGFAVYLGELSRTLQTHRTFDVDVLLLYKPQQNAALVAKAVESLAQTGSVRAESFAPRGLRAAKTLVLLDDGTVKEATQC